MNVVLDTNVLLASIAKNHVIESFPITFWLISLLRALQII